MVAIPFRTFPVAEDRAVERADIRPSHTRAQSMYPGALRRCGSGFVLVNRHSLELSLENRTVGRAEICRPACSATIFAGNDVTSDTRSFSEKSAPYGPTFCVPDRK